MKRFDNTKIKNKLALSFAIVVVSMPVMGDADFERF